MYQFSQQPQECSQLARLPLAKFSHTATSISHGGPLSWSHIIGNGDIIGVFEKRSGVTTSTARILLRVSRDCDVLEEIDIAHFAREAVAQAQSRQIGHGHPKPIFAVIVKSPCLAVKYPSGGTSVRRFQIKFSSDRDYYTALAILSDIKCPFSESNIGSLQPARKLTSSQWNPGLGSSASGVKDALPNGPGALGMSSSNNVIFPSHSSTTSASGMTSTITGPPLPSSSSGTAHTAADFTTTTRPDTFHSEPNTLNQSSQDVATRPSTAAATVCHDPQTLNQLLPPKRDLPFSKPAAKPAAKKPRTRTSKQPTPTSTSGDTSTRPSSTGTDQQATPSTQAPKPSPKKGPIQDPKKPNLKRCYTSIQDLNHAQNTPQTNIYTPSYPIPSAQQHISSDPPFSVHQINTTTMNTNGGYQATHHLTETPSTIATQGHHDILTTADFSTYLSAPTSERTASLEDWICKHIEDDGFLQLCQDVEGVWKRVALGM